MSKLQLLTTKFENLRMEDDETISEFNTRLRDIANSTFALGEKILEEKLARKILRSLPKRFNIKVTAIEESQDLSTMKVDELIGSLQTFEMAFDERPEKKLKNLAFTSKEGHSDESIAEAIAFIAKKVNKTLNKVQAKWRTNVPDKVLDIKPHRRVKDENNYYKKKRCSECEGHGHNKHECPNYLRLEKRGMKSTLSEFEEVSNKEVSPTTIPSLYIS
jgi:hypothetical protein